MRHGLYGRGLGAAPTGGLAGVTGLVAAISRSYKRLFSVPNLVAAWEPILQKLGQSHWLGRGY